MTTKEFEKYLLKIGGLENGWRAWPNKYSQCEYEWLSKVNYYAFAVLHYMKIPERSNPFRSRIHSRGFFSVGEGWLQLVHDCIEELIKAGWNKQICQVKEKFAGLRFYANGTPEGGNEIISKYEKLSYETCEVCGQPGEPNDERWVRTLCPQHTEQSKQKQHGNY